jgi:hypothetical protein
VIVFFGPAVQDAAVAGGADLPLDLEFEIAELLAGHDVLDRQLLGERAVDDRPTGGKAVAPVAAPPTQ